MPRPSKRDAVPLDHPTRRALFDAVESSPGICLTDLAKRVDAHHSTVRHHVRVLTDENLLVTVKQLGKRRYFPEHEEHLTLAAALSEPSKAAILHALAIDGEAHGDSLAEELGRHPSTITHHLQTLADAGLVERRKRGRTVVNRLAPFVERILDTASREPDDEERGTQTCTPADSPSQEWTAPNTR